MIDEIYKKTLTRPENMEVALENVTEIMQKLLAYRFAMADEPYSQAYYDIMGEAENFKILNKGAFEKVESLLYFAQEARDAQKELIQFMTYLSIGINQIKILAGGEEIDKAKIAEPQEPKHIREPEANTPRAEYMEGQS